MTVPTTNVRFSLLQTEFGGTNPISLSEYYRGGANVPSGTTSSYGTIPTSGAISVGVFRGTSAATAGTASLTAHTLSAEAVSYNLQNASSFARLEVDIDKILYGSVSMTTGNGDKIGQIDSTYYAATALDQVLESWTTGTPSLWSVRAVTISAPGAGLSGDLRDTWLPLTSARSWTVSAASSSSLTYQSRTFTFTLQLALTSNTSNVLASANMSLTATADTNAGAPP